MRFLIDSARKDLRRRLADPVALLLWIGIPVMIGGLMGLASGGGSAKPRIELLLVDQDDTFLSRFLAGARSQGELGDYLDVELVELEAGRARIEAGDATALLVLPEGLTEAILKEEPAELRLVTNPAQHILPSMLEEGLEMLVEAAFYLQRWVGEPLREMADGPPEGQDFFADETVASFSAEINRRMRGLDGMLFPPVLKLEMEASSEEQEDGFNFAIFFLPGVLFMSLLFIAQGISEDVWKEKDQGTLRRAVSAPQGVAVFLGGKLAAGTVVMVAVSLAGLVLSVVGFGIPAAPMVLGLVWCTFCGTGLIALFVAIQLLASSQRAGNILTSVVLFPLMMLGGTFFPFEAMPSWMARVGRWTPNGVGVTELKKLMTDGPDPASLLLGAAGIALVAALCFAFASSRLARFAAR